MIDDENLAAQIEIEVQRIAEVARRGITASYEMHPDKDLRVDDFVLSVIFAFEDEDGDTCDNVGVFSGSKRHHAQEGILHRAIRSYW